MSWHLTTGELTFAVPLGVIAGAAISLVGQRLTNVANLRRSRSERLWDRRSDLYMRTLAEAEQLREDLVVLTVTGRWSKNQEVADALESHREALRSLNTELKIFSSVEVYDQFEEYGREVQALYLTVSAAAKEEATKTPVPILEAGMERLCERLDRANRGLTLALRNDLTVGE